MTCNSTTALPSFACIFLPASNLFFFNPAYFCLVMPRLYPTSQSLGYSYINLTFGSFGCIQVRRFVCREVLQLQPYVCIQRVGRWRREGVCVLGDIAEIRGGWESCHSSATPSTQSPRTLHLVIQRFPVVLDSSGVVDTGRLKNVSHIRHHSSSCPRPHEAVTLGLVEGG